MAELDPAISLRPDADRRVKPGDDGGVVSAGRAIGYRILLCLLLALGLPSLAGCGGWAPLYADVETGPADESLRAITVAPIPERIGQKLALALRESLNPNGLPAQPHYVLRTTLQTVRSDLGVQSFGLGTRGKLDVTASYVVAESRTNASLLTATSHVAESFDILANEYAATVAETDAATRAVEELRRDILSQLTVFMQHRSQSGGPPGPAAPGGRLP